MVDSDGFRTTGTNQEEDTGCGSKIRTCTKRARAFGNLSKLIDGGVVKKTWNKVDARTKYYEVIDKKLAEQIIEKYKGRIAFRLARFVPYKRTLAERLKSDDRFVESCQHFGLTISEGIKAVKMCPKIGYEWNSNRLFIWRTEQGYIPPENPKEPEKSETGEPEVEEVE